MIYPHVLGARRDAAYAVLPIPSLLVPSHVRTIFGQVLDKQSFVRRRWFNRFAMKLQFTIRMAMLATLVASVGLAYFAFYQRQLQRRLHAMSEIERDFGFVTFRNENGGIVIEITEDVRRYDRLECIYLAGSKLEPRTLEFLPSLNDAQFISFNSSVFADEHVKYLDEFTNLRDLQLNGTLITKIGLEHLSKRHRLTGLTLNDTAVDDQAVDILTAMKTLKKLYVRNTGLSDRGIKRIQSELPHCQIVR